MSIRPVEKIDNLVPVKHVMISVSDKSYLSILVQGLLNNCPDVIIYSSGGTFKEIKEIIGEKQANLHLMEVSEYTRLPETEGGLVKTLHHKLFLGYLTETYCEAHQKDLERENAVPIDLVVINLYPFKEVVKKDGATIEDARGNIDVGGPSALRAAAKNWHRVMTLTNPNDYFDFLQMLQNGCTCLYSRYQAFKKTFLALSSYDFAIYDYFEDIKPEIIKETYEINNQ